MLLVSKFQELSPEHDAAVDEILLREFPLYKGHGWFDQKATQREKDAAQARFDEILALPKDQVIGQLREEAARKEDEQRNAYYAKCNTPINWSHWGNLPLMPLVSACKMMTGFNPEHPEHAIDEADKGRDSSVRPRWANLYHQAISAEKANQLAVTRDLARSWEEVSLRELVNFILLNKQSNPKCPWTVPDELQHLTDDSSKKTAATWEGFDEDSPMYPRLLDMACQAHRAMTNNPDEQGTPKERITRWLAKNYSQLSTNAKKQIAAVCNWDSNPGRRTKKRDS